MSLFWECILSDYFDTTNFLKEKTQNSTEYCQKYLEYFGHFDANFMKIGFLLLKILQFNIFKMAANGGRHFEINIKTAN